MYQLFCDSNSEIPYWFAEENGLKVVSMPYVLDNQEYYYDLGRNTDFKHFFQREREGSMPTTAALNVDNYIEIYEPTLKAVSYTHLDVYKRQAVHFPISFQ